MSAGWDAVWEARRLDPGRGSKLAQLMAADGLDTGFGDVEERSWLGFVAMVAARTGITAGSSVFEVGCGAGAFLFDLYRRGARVAGIDRSAALVRYAAEAMPGGCFRRADAASFDLGERAEVVCACGVFMYFADLAYARTVIRRMVAKATRAVAILDVPDLAARDQALAHRTERAGGARAYAERYAGLEHLYFDREWVATEMRTAGLVAVETEDQAIAGYENSCYRFNAFGRVPVEGRRPERS